MTRLASFKALSSTTSRQSISTRRSGTSPPDPHKRRWVQGRNRPRLPGGGCRQDKNAMERPFYGRDSCNEKKNEKSPPKKTHRQLSSDSSATFVPRRTPNGAPPRTAHIAISSSVAKSQDSSISEVYFPTTLTKSPYGFEGIRSWHAVTNVNRVVPRVIDTVIGERV